MTVRIKGISFLIGLMAICVFSLQAQESAASLYNTGLEKAKAKEYSEALSLFEQALETAGEEDTKVISLSKKNASRVAYALGFQHRKAEEYTEALAMHEKGLGYNPDYYSNYSGKAQVLEAMGKDTEAVTAYIKAGDMATSAGEADKAESYYNKASNFVAKAAIDEKWDEAMALATAFMETSREDADVYYYFGRAQSSKGNNAGALESVSKAIDLGVSADASKYYMLKGEIHASLGQTTEAIAAYGKVSDPTYAERAKYEIDQLQN